MVHVLLLENNLVAIETYSPSSITTESLRILPSISLWQQMSWVTARLVNACLEEWSYPDSLHINQVYELKRGGTDISLTKSNSVEYIHLMAHYRLNVQLHRQFQAFRSGLEAVIPSKWLRLFSQNELQVLISGAEVPINIEDLRQNTSYLGTSGKQPFSFEFQFYPSRLPWLSPLSLSPWS